MIGSSSEKTWNALDGKDHGRCNVFRRRSPAGHGLYSHAAGGNLIILVKVVPGLIMRVFIGSFSACNCSSLYRKCF